MYRQALAALRPLSLRCWRPEVALSNWLWRNENLKNQLRRHYNYATEKHNVTKFFQPPPQKKSKFLAIASKQKFNFDLKRTPKKFHWIAVCW